eukprot:jgi/Tetstr1/451908/TSEL_038944.t1
MLGGAVDTHISFDRDALVLNEAAERIVETRVLAARYPEAEIFLSGGGGHPSSDGNLTESELARGALIDAGVAPERLAMEERSRNTSSVMALTSREQPTGSRKDVNSIWRTAPLAMARRSRIVGGGYESDMPGFADVLTDDEIWAVLDYIKSTWPERERGYQAQISARDN